MAHFGLKIPACSPILSAYHPAKGANWRASGMPRVVETFPSRELHQPADPVWMGAVKSNSMEKLDIHAVTFGVPILLYLLWLARLQKKCPFPGLLIIAIVAVWISLWPVYFGPEHRQLSDEAGDKADTVLIGFMFLGWLNGLIGCLPVILVEISRTIVLIVRKRRANRVALRKPRANKTSPTPEPAANVSLHDRYNLKPQSNPRPRISVESPEVAGRFL